MPSVIPPRWRLMLVLALALVLVAALAPSGVAKGGHHHPPGIVSVGDVESLGVVTFGTGTVFADTEVGGLSGITYDAQRGVYYALSDDRSQIDPARFYTVAIDMSDGFLDAGDVQFVDVTFLTDHNGDLFEPRSIDPESIELVRRGQLYISTEGDSDSDPVIDPVVARFNARGKLNRALPVPNKFLPDGTETFGIRDNLAFESLTVSPDRRYLYTATENALVQDGLPSTLTNQSPSRFLQFRVAGSRAVGEFVYFVDQIPVPPVPPDSFADHGLVDIQALDNAGTFLTMERSFAVGVGNTILLFEASTRRATDVSGWDSIMGHSYEPMSKELVANFKVDLGVTPDNVEGMTFGPKLPDGRQVLIVVSDNNFNPSQTTQFIALAVELDK